MYAPDDSLTQKWHFVPANARPDGRLVVLLAKYFFVVNQKNGLVLDNSTGMKDGDLVLSEADGSPCQCGDGMKTAGWSVNWAW